MNDERETKESIEFELVRRLRPATLDPSPELLARERAALVELVRQERRGKVRRRRMVVAGVAVAACVVTVLATGVSSVLEPSTRVTCLDGSAVPIGADPVTTCVVQWREEKEGTAPPPLAAYEDEEGEVRVVAADEPPQPDLRPFEPAPPPAHTPDVAALEQLDELLVDRVDGLYARCTPTADARAFAEALLADPSFPGWAVEVDGEEVDGKSGCTVPHIDVTRRRVVLSAVAPGGGGGPESREVQLVRRLRAVFVGNAATTCLSLAEAAAIVREEARAAGLAGSIEAMVREVADDRVSCAVVRVPARTPMHVIVRGRP